MICPPPQVQHVLARADPLPERPHHLLGEDRQDDDARQRLLRGVSPVKERICF